MRSPGPNQPVPCGAAELKSRGRNRPLECDFRNYAAYRRSSLSPRSCRLAVRPALRPPPAGTIGLDKPGPRQRSSPPCTVARAAAPANHQIPEAVSPAAHWKVNFRPARTSPPPEPPIPGQPLQRYGCVRYIVAGFHRVDRLPGHADCRRQFNVRSASGSRAEPRCYWRLSFSSYTDIFTRHATNSRSFVLNVTLLRTRGNTAELFGRKNLDSSGLPASGATVTAEDQATRAKTVARTNENGLYHLLGRAAGGYMLIVEEPGFRTYRQSGIVLRLGDRTEIGVKLELGQPAQSVEVSAAAPLLETSSGSVSFHVDEKRVVTLPLDGRNFVPPGCAFARRGSARRRIVTSAY